MKFNVLIISTLVLLLGTGCGTVMREHDGQSSAIITFEEALVLCKTPRDVSYWITGTIKYKADETLADEDRPALETVRLGYGDCEDFAILAKYMLDKHGYTTYVMAMYPPYGTGHSICLIDNGTYYNYLTNGIFVINPKPTLEAVIMGFYPTYSHWILK